MLSLFGNLRRMSLAARSGILLFTTAVPFVVVTPFAVSLEGWMGVAAAAAAAAFCLIGAVLALAIGHVLRDPRFALHAMLAGMAARMGIPLALALFCQLRGGLLADAGLIYYLLVIYPVTLAAETILSLPLSIEGQRQNPSAIKP
jgi:hypothetical protein